MLCLVTSCRDTTIFSCVLWPLSRLALLQADSLSATYTLVIPVPSASATHQLRLLWALNTALDNSDTTSGCLSLWLIGTVRAEPETVISRAWVQSPDRAE